jgi:hypothetical protein
MSDKIRLEGRVAQILNARELIINIGSEGGIKPKMKFAVLSEYPLEVVDPTTKEVLDVVDREKVRVEVSEIRPRIAICRTYRVKRITGGTVYQGLLGSAVSDHLFRSPREIPETLEAKNASLPPPLTPEESYVKINDRVVQVFDND